MQYKYLLVCWVRPRSGYDLARKNRVMKLIKEILSLESFKDIAKDMFPEDIEITDEKLQDGLNRFEKLHDGMVIEPFIMESDTLVKDPEKELLPEIQKDHPEATIFSFKMIPQQIPDKESE